MGLNLGPSVTQFSQFFLSLTHECLIFKCEKGIQNLAGHLKLHVLLRQREAENGILTKQ